MALYTYKFHIRFKTRIRELRLRGDVEWKIGILIQKTEKLKRRRFKQTKTHGQQNDRKLNRVRANSNVTENILTF